MKFTVFLLSASILLASCGAKDTDPQPVPAPAAAAAAAAAQLQPELTEEEGPAPTPQPEPASSTYMEFRCYDTGSGGQFNAALNARVYYFPQSTTDAQIKAFFGNPDTNPNWLAPSADEEHDFENMVDPDSWSAEPGHLHMDFKARKRIAIVWTFSEASETAPRHLKEQLFIWDGEGENQNIYTDQQGIGLQ